MVEQFKTYEEFRKTYVEFFRKMMTYHPNEIGAVEYADKMARLEDNYPQWAERAEEER